MEEQDEMICKPFHITALLLLLLASVAVVWAQSDRGTITGTVTDTSGAVIADVDVVATQTLTGVEFKTVSNHLGFYSLVQLPIGSYHLTFSKSGFKDFQRVGIQLATQHTVQIDAVLQIGAATETVTVTGSPVLEIQTEVGTNMDAQAMTDLPLSVNGGRDITSFAFAVTPNVSGSQWSTSIAGSQAFTKSVMIDGTSTDSGIVGQIGESEPSMDAIQESQVDTTGLRAEDGRSGGGAFLYEMKSGTNQFHGSSFGFLANEFLNANSWDNNWYLSQCDGDATCNSEYRRPMNRYQDYGFSAGGPIWKRRKMFIFGAYERYMQQNWQTTATGGTVPTTRMLTGDFSELLTAAANAKGTTLCPSSPCAIMNGTTPYTDSEGNTIYYGSIFSPQGTVYSGNIITDTISPIAKKITDIYQKYYVPTTSGVANNYPSLSNNEPWFHQNQLSFKFDWAVSSNDHVAVSYIYNLRKRTCTGTCGSSASSALWQTGSHDGGPLTFSLQQTTISNEYRSSETHTFSPTLLNVIAYTFNQFQNKSVPMTTVAGSTTWPTQVGLDSVDSLNLFPYINFSGSPNGLGETTIGNYYDTSGYVAYNGIVNDLLTWSKGRHSIKFGMEYRALGFNSDEDGGALKYTFSNNTFAPTTSGVQSYVGSSFANFMLGEAQSANKIVPFVLDSRRKELAFFAQDDIRINNRFNVSADVRWELTRPLHVLDGKWSNFDPTVTSEYYGVKGAITWLNHPNDSFETYTDWHQIAPKIGASYLITPKLTARGSLGINFVPLGWNGYSGTPYGSAVGFTGTNQVNKVSDSAAAFQWDASNYPGVYTAPTGADPSSSYIPWGPASVDPHSRQLGFTENWFAGLQYQLPGNAKIEISYLGNSGRNLHDGALNPKNFPTWSTYQPLAASGKADNWVWDAASAASNGVPYPYAGFSGPAYAALNPFPQVYPNAWSQVAFVNTPIGKSGYNAITVEGVKQRGSLNLDLSYNWSRATGNTSTAFLDTWTFSKGYQDPYKYDWEAHWPYTSQTVKGYLTYGLPFGNGRRFLSGYNRWINYAVSGWTAGTIVSYYNGSQMGAISSSNDYAGWSGVYTDVVSHPNFKNQFKKYDPSWNPTASGAVADSDSLFVDTSNFSNPTFGNLGNSPSMFTKWRGWATPSENASLLKKTRFGSDGRFNVTLRAEFFNVFNRHYWGGPNTNISSAYFGHVTGVSGYRTGQLGARFEW